MKVRRQAALSAGFERNEETYFFASSYLHPWASSHSSPLSETSSTIGRVPSPSLEADFFVASMIETLPAVLTFFFFFCTSPGGAVWLAVVRLGAAFFFFFFFLTFLGLLALAGVTLSGPFAFGTPGFFFVLRGVGVVLTGGGMLNLTVDSHPHSVRTLVGVLAFFFGFCG